MRPYEVASAILKIRRDKEKTEENLVLKSGFFLCYINFMNPISDSPEQISS